MLIWSCLMMQCLFWTDVRSPTYGGFSTPFGRGLRIKFSGKSFGLIHVVFGIAVYHHKTSRIWKTESDAIQIGALGWNRSCYPRSTYQRRSSIAESNSHESTWGYRGGLMTSSRSTASGEAPCTVLNLKDIHGFRHLKTHIITWTRLTKQTFWRPSLLNYQRACCGHSQRCLSAHRR